MNFAIRNNEIMKVQVVKESGRGTSCWCDIGKRKSVLIPYGDLFYSEEEAFLELEKRMRYKETIKIKTELDLKRDLQEHEEKKEIADRIFLKHGIHIRYLTLISSTAEDLREYEQVLLKR